MEREIEICYIIWLRRLQVINRRLDAIEDIIAMKNTEPKLVANLTSTLSRVQSLIKSLSRMKRAAHT